MPKKSLVKEMLRSLKMPIKNKISNKIYDFVVYNYRIKKMAFYTLRSPFITRNPIYNFFYEKEIKNKMRKHKEIPFRVMIENTNTCDARCTFCPHKKMKRSVGTMEHSLFERIINECLSLRIDYITIYGFGEPLLDPGFFKKVRYAKCKGIKRVTTNTNGYFLNRDKAKEAIESGLDEIYISIDAATEETYAKIRPNLNLKTVEENIKELVQIRRNKDKSLVLLSYVESIFNKHETRKFLSKWTKIVDNVSISQIHNWTGEIDYGESNISHRKKDPCRLLWNDMVINWDGSVPLCCNDYEGRIILGNMKTDSIQDIWGGKKLEEIRNFHIKREFHKIPICEHCEYNFHDKSAWWISK